MLDRELVEKTEAFLKQKFDAAIYLNKHPEDKAYRIEHTYRVANIGREIAEKEGFDETEMVIACLLHDVAYCEEFGENGWKEHGRRSAAIARPFLKELGPYDEQRVKFLTCQEVEDEFSAGRKLLEELAAYAGKFSREPVPVSELVVGMKCGGSDGLSGITANPTVGRFSDMLTARGGSTVLTEVPEMFGAEGFLMDRCVNEEVFHKAEKMLNGFKDYFIRHGEVVYDNPSPGNKQGGITTLEDKSCGCVQKGGTAPIADVIGYGDPVVTKGLNMLYGPGNDLVSATAMTASGAHLILFTTGRGTPFGAPAPTLKIATNSQLAQKKSGWIDFNAGSIVDGETIQEAAQRLLELVIETAGGKKTKAEERGFREISIFKDGVVL